MKIKMDVKAEVLSKKFQDSCRISKIDGEVCHGKHRVQHTFRTYDEDAFKSKMDQYQLQEEDISHLRENAIIQSIWRRLIPRQGG
jgi:hypothetical protein